MFESGNLQLTDRQRRELEYHRTHAKEHETILDEQLSWDVLKRPSRRWWNAYWQMYTHLTALDLKGKRALVVGCGFGDDALLLAKLGVEVYAFDLSPESLALARKIAERENLAITFDQMPAETLSYPSDFFDCFLVRDILHHADVPQVMAEIHRVAKPGALLVVNEIYTHSMVNRIRYWSLVDKVLYPRMRRFIYGTDKPYITEDERKLNEVDLKEVTKSLGSLDVEKYFNFLVTRLVPDRYVRFAKLDRRFLAAIKPLGRFLGGRVLLCGHISK